MKEIPFEEDDDEMIGDLEEAGYSSRNDWLDDMRGMMDPEGDSDDWDDED